MPNAVYDNKFTEERVGPKVMPTPKRIEDPQAWVREARKVIPAIPDVSKTDWMITDFDTALDIILIGLANTVGEKANIAIDRRVKALG